MDGKWKWPLVLLLLVCALPKMLWYKLFPPKPSPMEEYLQAEQKRALEQRQLDALKAAESFNSDIPVTAEEEEEWRRLEKQL